MSTPPAAPAVRPLVQGVVTRPLPRPDATLRLFLFHHAGGSHLLYRGWEQFFPGDWELCLVDAPGRGRLSDRPALDDADRLIDHLDRELAAWLDRPYAFFGHSMGALVAWELANRLTASGRRPPLWLGLSSCGAPSTGHGSGPRARHELTDPELRQWLRELGATPPAVLEDDLLWKVFAPTFRSDFALVDTWRPDPAATLPVALSSFGGTADRLVDRRRLAAWEHHTHDFRGLHVYAGDHFYLTAQPRPVTRQIVAAVSAVRRAGPAVPAADAVRAG
ncbi:thioesterase domain-containing protein [Kitasatospora cineracea]|uniref:thioesterase II family protein n=1 Tax=Kitasatospora cineracea TaxID=88074 RepID=UPI00343EFD15